MKILSLFSYALNCALVLFILARPSQPKHDAVPSPLSTAGTSAALALDVPQVAAEAATPSVPDPVDAIELLRSSGVSRRTIVDVARAIIDDKFRARRAAVMKTENRFTWESLERRSPTAEQQAELTKLMKEQQAELLAMIGEEDFNRATYVGERESDPFIGGFGFDKLVALGKLVAEYNEMKVALARQPGRVPSDRDFAMLDAELAADMKGMLTPEEYAAYTVSRSDFSRQLAGTFRGMDITDSQFAEVSIAATAEPDLIKRTDVVREKIGDDAAMAYLQSVDRSFGPSVRALQEAGMSVDAILRARAAFAKKPENGYINGRVRYAEVTAEMTPEQLSAFLATPLGKSLKAAAENPPRPQKP